MTPNINKQIIFLIIFLCTVIEVWSQSPQNAIAVLNGQVKISCNVDPSSFVNWVKNAVPGNPNLILIASGCKIESSFTANYAVESGSNFCNLIVSNVNMQHAGTYSCVNTGDGGVSRAVLTVIDPNANVMVLNSTALAEDELVNISCNLAYNTSQPNLPRLIPTLSWKVPVGQSATGVISDAQTNSANSIITVMSKRPNLPIFECGVNFNLSGNLSNFYATNIPSSPVTWWKTSMIFDVLYPPIMCSISSENIVNIGICGLKLSCVASSNPPARYRWVDVNNTQPFNDSQPCNSLNDALFCPFPKVGRIYQCTAYNVIKGKDHNTSCTFTFPSQTQSPQPCDESTTPTQYPSITYNMTVGPADKMTGSQGIIIAIVVPIGWVAINLLVMTLFLLNYNRHQEHKIMLNRRFQFLTSMLSCMNEKPLNIGWIFLFVLTSIIAGVIVFPILLIVAICCSRENNYKTPSDTPSMNLQDCNSSTGNENPQSNSKPSKQQRTNAKPDPFIPTYTEVIKHSRDLPQSNQNDRSSPQVRNLGGKGSPNHQQLPVRSPYDVVGTEYQEFRPNKEANITPKQFLDAGGEYASLDIA